ncbi:hypothetical protein BDFB_012452 [Asbolus verrucosus]|uniref:Uncharacterized protein n=1 Tax=Asbolus verrucosus TaxID=1661398 RepID=A0A482V8Y6_ASBVE|nr:hypothetical protein BDFB_012452 [Asbolus verrucosus]
MMNLNVMAHYWDAAQAIMDAQRRELNEITIPRHIFYGRNILRLLPLKAQLYIMDFIGVGLESDLE